MTTMYKYDVFISYSWAEKNRELVDDLYNYLTQNGIVPWKVDAGMVKLRVIFVMKFKRRC